METINSRPKNDGPLDDMSRPLWQRALIVATLIGPLLYTQNQNQNNNPTRDDVRSLHAPQVVQTEPQDSNGDAKPNISTDPDEITELEEVEKRTTIPNILDNQEIAETENSSTKI